METILYNVNLVRHCKPSPLDWAGRPQYLQSWTDIIYYSVPVGLQLMVGRFWGLVYLFRSSNQSSDALTEKYIVNSDTSLQHLGKVRVSRRGERRDLAQKKDTLGDRAQLHMEKIVAIACSFLRQLSDQKVMMSAVNIQCSHLFWRKS